MTKTAKKKKKKKKKKQTAAERKAAKHWAKMQRAYQARRKKLTPAQRKSEDAASKDRSLRWDATDAINKGVKDGSIKVDYRGHFHGYYPGWFERKLMMMLMDVRHGKTAEILVNRAQGKRDSRTAFLTYYDLSCNSCSSAVKFKILKNKLVATSECTHPTGYPAYSVKVNVPSGKMIFGNDFRDLVSMNADYNVNGTRGTERTSQAYADAGMIHIFVGNTCPGIYKVSESRLNIVSPSSRSGGKADDYKELPTKPPKGKGVGSICTDLWWYSAMDYDLFKKLAKEKYGKNWKGRIGDAASIVKVKPGCYQAIAQAHRVRDVDFESTEDDGYYSPEELFSYIKRVGNVRKLEPQSGYAEAEAFVMDFEQAIAIRRMAWPTITHDRNSVLNDFFLTLGGGYEWKEGALISISGRTEDAVARYKAGERPNWEQDEREKEREETMRILGMIGGDDYVEPRPTFYPISEDYAHCFKMPDNVRPDWLAGCRELLRIVIGNGTGPKPAKGDSEEITRNYNTNKSNVRLSKKALKKLEERFGRESDRFSSTQKEE